MEILHNNKRDYPRLSSSNASCQIDYLTRCENWERGILAVPYTLNGPNHRLSQISPNHVYFDIETVYMPDDIGYSRNYANDHREEIMPKQRLGLAVTLDHKGKVGCWDECGAKEMISYLLEHDTLVSFNGLRFDNLVLSGYASTQEIGEIDRRSFDLLAYIQELTGSRRSLEVISERIGVGGNMTKSLIKQGLGYEEGKLVKGFTSKAWRNSSVGNNIPLILREGAAAQKRLVWVACFEDVFNMAAIIEELVLEQEIMKCRDLDINNGNNYRWLYD